MIAGGSFSFCWLQDDYIPEPERNTMIMKKALNFFSASAPELGLEPRTL